MSFKENVKDIVVSVATATLLVCCGIFILLTIGFFILPQPTCACAP